MTTAPIQTTAPADWLQQTVRPWRRALLLAGMLTAADVLPAIGFAGGLAMSVARAGDGLAAMAPWLVLGGVSLLARGFVAQATVALGARLARTVKVDTRDRLLFDLFGGGRRSSARMTAIVEGVAALDGYVGRFLPLRLAAGVSPLIIIAVAATASPVAAGVLVFTLLPFILGMALAGTAAAGESRRQFDAMDRLSGLFIDRIRALPAILAFNAGRKVTGEVRRAADELERRTSRVMRIAFVSSAVLEFFSALSVALIAVYCGFNLLRLLPFPVPETLDLARAFFVLALAPEVYAPLRRLASAYHDRQAAEAAVPALAIPPEAPPRDRFILPPNAPAIRFQQVRIAYGEGPAAIEGFDLDVRAGQMVALVGASGSGKSSLLHLLLGLAPLSGGEVEIGGLKLSEAGDLAGQIAWASQNPIVVPGSLDDNIRLADRSASSGRIMTAAAQAGLTGDLERRLDERGGGLSGGERRRLGLARALLKPAPILLLDEPTANLDPLSEQAVLEIIGTVAAGRTTLIATHSPAVIAMANRVVRL